MTLVFVDLETTGLDPSVHEVWEVAYAVDDGPIVSGLVPHLGASADPTALAMNGYRERTARIDPRTWSLDLTLREAVTGATVVGANPAFDASFLRARWGVAPWKYRLFDVEAYAAGVLNFDVPRGLATITGALTALGHTIPTPDHSAAGDVATLRACFRTLQAIAQASADRDAVNVEDIA